jgi:hypothetical protein
MSSYFSKKSTGTPDVEVQVADRAPKQYYLNTGAGSTNTTTLPPPAAPGFAPHVSSPFDVGIFKDTLLPSLGLHSGFAVIAYGLARATNRVEVKDYLCGDTRAIATPFTDKYQGLRVKLSMHGGVPSVVASTMACH